jgi:hypothetical protein
VTSDGDNEVVEANTLAVALDGYIVVEYILNAIEPLESILLYKYGHISTVNTRRQQGIADECRFHYRGLVWDHTILR